MFTSRLVQLRMALSEQRLGLAAAPQRRQTGAEDTLGVGHSPRVALAGSLESFDHLTNEAFASGVLLLGSNQRRLSRLSDEDLRVSLTQDPALKVQDPLVLGRSGLRSTGSLENGPQSTAGPGHLRVVEPLDLL
ncbi:MAG: hypothetical protein AAF657_36900, partial [Acidobacteriota bacterium]